MKRQPMLYRVDELMKWDTMRNTSTGKWVAAHRMDIMRTRFGGGGI